MIFGPRRRDPVVDRRGRRPSGPPGAWTVARISAALAGGVVTYYGFAPKTWWWAPIAGFALLGLALAGRGWRAAGGLGFVFGSAMYLPLLVWSGIYVGDLPWVALALVEGALVGAAITLIGPVTRRLPLWPMWAAGAWVLGETVRAEFPFGGFPWGAIAFTQADGPLLPLVAVFGEAGLSFTVILVGFGAAAIIRLVAVGQGAASRKHVLLVALASLIVPTVAAGVSRLAMVDATSATTVPIGIVQGNVPKPGLEFNERRRAVLDLQIAQTARLRDAVAAGEVPRPQLVIWSENASDIDPFRNRDAYRLIDDSVRSIGVPTLVGAVVRADAPNRLYNKAIVWDPVDGPGAEYTKRLLVPFGEYMPARGFFRLFSKYVDRMTNEFLPGTAPGNLTVAGIPIGDVICFEIVKEPIVRDVIRGGAQVLVVQTNNATFGYTHETYQQQAMSRIRAVEYGRAVLIAAISGISAVVQPDGSVTQTLPLFEAGFMIPQVPLTDRMTPAVYLGEIVRWLLTLITPLALAGTLVARRRAGRTTPSKASAGRPEGLDVANGHPPHHR